MILSSFGFAEASSAGYLFCSEIMPTGHELRLMLINTLLKVNFKNSLPSVVNF